MKKFVLIGQPETERTEYFMKAAQESGTAVDFYEIFSPECDNISNAFIKIDPPQYTTAQISGMDQLTDKYCDFLRKLEKLPNCTFLNSPQAIIQTLNKTACKKLLMDHAIPTTHMLATQIHNYDELRHAMTQANIAQAFIKPDTGSGAAGVCAYRVNRSGQEKLFTSMRIDNGILFNTRKIRGIINHAMIEALLDALFKMPTIVEEWVSKASFNGHIFDLRVLYQFGKVDFAVARLSKSPITNLHLNNNALPIDELQLSEHTLAEIAALCECTMPLFAKPARLNYAGFDILLTHDTKKPMIIEINGQGDLLYLDILNENRIYKNQIEYGVM
jgi:glutathione synthase/RimK-type ligase-like ATP-grasp enzyme